MVKQFDPELGKFVAKEKFYKEEKNPDYVLPETEERGVGYNLSEYVLDEGQIIQSIQIIITL